jgi:hypothetical protein
LSAADPMQKRSGKRRAPNPPEAQAEQPKRGNSIVDAAYSAAMFSDRGDHKQEQTAEADSECEAG